MSTDLVSREVKEDQAIKKVFSQFVEKLKGILAQVEGELDDPELKKSLEVKGYLPCVQIRLEGCTYVITRYPEVGRPELSQRQREVLVFLVNGLARREIAEKLDISARTVDTHFDRLLEKLGVDNRVQLIRWASFLLS